jgi:tight adherence protein C
VLSIAIVQTLLTFAILGAVGFAVWWVVVSGGRRQRITERLQAEQRVQFETVAPVPDEDMSWLRRWLYVAGFHRPDAGSLFFSFAVATIVLGLALALILRGMPATGQAIDWLHTLPGGIGALMAPVLLAMPWVVALIIACLPWLHVRAARRRRVKEVEQDLPITLQVLATLARAGLGFDAALIRVLESGEPGRTLYEELQTFRRDTLSGIPRAQCWRRLARRIDIPSVSTFVSAMIHSEQVGGGLSGVLEHQTEDALSRRRETALIQAYSLPAKLVFPLVLCFLPGIFVWTLGPAFYQFLQVLNTVMQQRT